MSGPDAVTAERWRRPVRVRLDIADRALRADIAAACDDAGIAMAEEQGAADVILIDRPAATGLPAVAVVPDGARRAWPASVCAVVPADIDAETLAAVIAVVAAGYALTTRRHAGTDTGDAEDGDEQDQGEDAGGVTGAWIASGGATDARGSSLSPRERQVLALLAAGAANKEIAIALGLSVSTVKFHVAAITAKLGARSRVDAVAIAVRAGLVMV